MLYFPVPRYLLLLMNFFFEMVSFFCMLLLKLGDNIEQLKLLCDNKILELCYQKNKLFYLKLQVLP